MLWSRRYRHSVDNAAGEGTAPDDFTVDGKEANAMSPINRHDPSHATGAATALGMHLPIGGHAEAKQPRGTLSIIVPAKNEAESLPQLASEIIAAFRPIVASRDASNQLESFEVVIVDDGSTDDTPAVLRRLCASYAELRSLRLVANVGQSGATAAGFRAANGEWVAVLDADLQNDPADLPKLWDALPGHDAALGWRLKRRDVWSKRVISRWANRIRNAVLGQTIKDTGCSVRIFPRDVALRLPLFNGMHRFLGPLLLREGCRIVQVPVNHRPRPHGQSHYNLWNRSLKVVVDLFGVAWLMRRPIRSEIASSTESVAARSSSAAQSLVAGREI
jgi:dolichol-phosphate mannosyltransferase